MSERVNVLVIGKGGREHALVWKLAPSPRAGTVYCAPGNAGTARDGVNVDLDVNDFDKLARFARKEDIGLTVVGPEEPLARGIVAFTRERYDECVELLREVRPVAHRFGGSHAQRDVIHLTLVEAALRAGRSPLARALAAERVDLKPESPFNRLLASRAAQS